MSVNPDIKFYNVHHEGSTDLTQKHRPGIESVQTRMSALAEHSFKHLGLQFQQNNNVIKFGFEGCKISAETSYASLIALAAKTKHVANQLRTQPQEQFNEAKAKELMNESYKYFFEYDKDGEIKEVKMYKFDKTTKKLAQTPEKISITKAERDLIKKMAEAVPPTAAVELQEVVTPTITVEPIAPNLGGYKESYDRLIEWVGDGSGSKRFTPDLKEDIKKIIKNLSIDLTDDERNPRVELVQLIRHLTSEDHLRYRFNGQNIQGLFPANFNENLEAKNIQELKDMLAEVISKIAEKEAPV